MANESEQVVLQGGPFDGRVYARPAKAEAIVIEDVTKAEGYFAYILRDGEFHYSKDASVRVAQVVQANAMAETTEWLIDRIRNQRAV